MIYLKDDIGKDILVLGGYIYTDRMEQMIHEQELKRLGYDKLDQSSILEILKERIFEQISILDGPELFLSIYVICESTEYIGESYLA